MGQVSRLERLAGLIEGQTLKSVRAEYRCLHIDQHCTVFDGTGSTNMVMIPTDILLEWISCYERGLITEGMTARQCREVVRKHSEWANQLHSFETHLYAVLRAWRNR